MSYTVYMHINKINNKKYVGFTGYSLDERWKNGKGYSKDTPFGQAIEKYGWDNFDHQILFSNLTLDEAARKEQDLIDEYHTYLDDPLCWGYNATRGGEGRSKVRHEEVTSLWEQGYSTKQIGQKLGVDRNTAGRILQNYENYSIKESVERGYEQRTVTNSRPVSQYDLNGNFIATYSSMSDAYEAIHGYRDTEPDGTRHSNTIGCACREGIKAYGFQWTYKDAPAPGPYHKEKNYHDGKAVDQYNLDGTFVKTYQSASEAARQLGLKSPGGISEVCRKHKGTSAKYLWKFHNEKEWWIK